jgi:WD40 repeat protein
MKLLMGILLMFVLAVPVAQGQDNPAWAAVASIAWSPDGSLLAVAEPMGRITIRDVDGDIIYTLLADETAIRDLSWSPDGMQLVSAGRDEAIKIWSLADGSLSQTIQTSSGSIGGSPFQVSWQPTGDLILASGLDTIGVWNAVDGSLVTTFGGVTILDMQWDPTGTFFAYASMGSIGVVEFLEGRDGIMRFNYPVIDPSIEPATVDWNTDGTQVVTSGGEDGSVRLWDAQTGEQIRVLLEIYESVTSAIFLDEDSVAAAASDGQIYILNTDSGTVEQTINEAGQVWAMSWSSETKTLAVGGLAMDLSTSDGMTIEANVSIEDSALLTLIPLQP